MTQYVDGRGEREVNVTKKEKINTVKKEHKKQLYHERFSIEMFH
jgi:hypothetical protein